MGGRLCDTRVLFGSLSDAWIRNFFSCSWGKAPENFIFHDKVYLINCVSFKNAYYNFSFQVTSYNKIECNWSVYDSHSYEPHY